MIFTLAFIRRLAGAGGAMALLLVPLVAGAAQTPAEESPPAAAPPAAVSPATEVAADAAAKVRDEAPSPGFELLGETVPAGAKLRLNWSAGEDFAGMAQSVPVLVANGEAPGPVLCLTAAVHGDELNGIEIVRRLLYRAKTSELRGTLVGIPIVNLTGFQRSSRYLADRRDLNRHFPGSANGSSASRIAYSLFHSVIRHCSVLVDLHTGSFHRTNLPQLRADLSNKAVVKVTKGFGATAVLDDKGALGTLRRAATEAGVPAVTLETGEPMRLQMDKVEHGVKAIRSLMAELGMVKKAFRWSDPQPVYYQSTWVRANHGGILISEVKLGDRVKAGETLGTVTDPVTNRRSRIKAPFDGRILGRALNQVVMPGFAAYRVGVQRSEDEVERQAEQPTAPTPPAAGPAEEPASEDSMEHPE